MVAKSKTKCLSCSAKLRIHGDSAASRRPCIVVLCDQAIERDVARLLEKRLNKEQILSKGDFMLPKFDTVVEARPPRRFSDGTASTVQVGVDASRAVTKLSGARLRCQQSGMISFATLGGIVQVENHGHVECAGLTVAHLMSGGDDEDLQLANEPATELSSEQGPRDRWLQRLSGPSISAAHSQDSSPKDFPKALRGRPAEDPLTSAILGLFPDHTRRLGSDDWISFWRDSVYFS